MSTIARSRSQPADRWETAVAVALAAVIFLGTWGLLHVGFWRHHQVVDVPVYQRYGEAITRGQIPYRDFTPEYPPLALPTFVVPALVSHDLEGFRAAFEVEMAACGLALVLLVALGARALGDGSRRLAATTAAVGLFPLALGTVVLTRFDLWPAALAAAALAALLAGRDRLGLGVLGLATAAKLYPAVLLPLAVVWVWRRRGRRAALVGLGVFAAAVAVCFLPFVALAPGGVADSLGRQLGRPLQIESLGGAILMTARRAEVIGGYGSNNIAGTPAKLLAAGFEVVEILALLWCWWGFARGRAEPERFCAYAAASVAAFVAFGKVLSPQYLIWLVPLVALVRGRRGFAAAGLLAAACLLTQWWTPTRYGEYKDEFRWAWVVLGRDVVLVALFAALAGAGLRRDRGSVA